MKKLYNLDVIMVLLAVSIWEIFAITPSLNETLVKNFLDLLFVLLPGYSITAVVFPLKKIGKLKRLLLSFVFSIALISLLNLGFNLEQTASPGVFMLFLSILTVSLVMISFIRRIRTDDELPKYPNSNKKFRLFERDTTFIKEKSISEPKYLPADILLIVMGTILCITFVVTPILNETIFRTVLGLFLILFLPGYSLIAALFPKKSDLDGIERVALSFGLSIAVTPLIGLLLNYTPFGIRLTPILLSLSAFTVLMISIAYIRRRKLPNNDRFNIRFKHYFSSMTGTFKRESGMYRFLSIVLVISIILAVSMTVYAVVVPKQGEKFTEFYILGPNGKVSDYPTNLTVGKEGKILIGVVNHEYAKTDYHMVIQLNGRTIKEENITLSNEEKWENTFTFSASKKGKNQKLEFLLYKLPDNNNVYRSLHLWINVDNNPIELKRA